MSERTLVIRNGKIVRPGFFRDAGGSGVAYASQVATGTLDAECVFCPEGLEKRGVEIIERLGEKGLGAFVIQASPAYAHFDAQRVVNHRLIIPDAHVSNQRDMSPVVQGLIGEYIDAAEVSAPEGTAIQDYTRRDRNFSKSITHLHTHLFTLSVAPLSRFAFNIDEGVTEAAFITPTDEQIAAIEQSRHHSSSSKTPA